MFNRPATLLRRINCTLLSRWIPLTTFQLPPVVDYAFPPFFSPSFFYQPRDTGVAGSVSRREGGHARFTHPLLFRHSFTRHAHAKRPANERRSLNFNEVPARRS